MITNTGNKSVEFIESLLKQAGLYEQADSITIQLLADTIDTYKGIKSDLEGSPIVYESAGDKGQVMYRQHPAGKLLLDYNDRITKLLTELNLTSKARKDVTTSSKDVSNQLKDFLNSDE